MQPPQRALTARSVILSALLGTHPPALPVRALVAITAMFGISEGSTRVALSRLVADGDLAAGQGTYTLNDRLLQRQREQDRSVRPPLRDWSGDWLLAGCPPGESPETPPRMGEVRPGLWCRPDNLDVPRDPSLWWFRGTPAGAMTPDELAGRLWDLRGWAQRAEDLVSAMSSSQEAAARFAVAAAMVRHLMSDPLLPPALLPGDWPGEKLRASYDSYRRELRQLVEGERDRL